MSNIHMTSEDFRVNSIIINSNRFSQPITITNLVTEVSVFESIYVPYLTGNMTFIDTNNLINDGDFSGTERITFEFSSAIEGYNPIKKTFVITNIDSIVANDDNSRTVFCSLTEDIFMLNESHLNASEF